ncbi:serine/threonine-protein phosphatase 6 regulatory ankyrin repeat subunit B-like [Rhodamnia argentea]|uniref:Serine/threonine-protein phosphatase 6 regulatory ankyrin repeat subunit B-like n=1 Tax=Rhodamnia argentea TaxID=178133 RepID=A0A8B8QDP3_9MYRT|nr:serine/threonine-protein phosphatase 6 regulatory ankyrin repeat subunit B-like [Rhodamnia argentea]XP_048127999.1 serine/threonine-protein phosphatase 6 regulatory ankyrin repeat subunit B-like [Rhodamnia argentea]
MPPTFLPLRCANTRDQWWCASPIECAAANGHYDLVRELLRIDPNHLIELTSLRRIHRLEALWEEAGDAGRFRGIAEHRSRVARQLLLEFDSKNKGSLVKGRYGIGGWLMYTAASAGDLGFVQELLERDPSLVLGEGEYGLTDILYAASRSRSREVFKVVLDFTVSPRALWSMPTKNARQGEVASLYRWEVMNRAVHAAARGGNLEILKELIAGDDRSDVLAYRDAHGSTVLHSAAGKGHVEVVEHLIQAFDIIDTTDHRGNLALHIAAHKGQLPTIQALISASPSSISSKNMNGETLLHMAISGLQAPDFRRWDVQIEMMKKFLSGEVFNVEDVINAKNNDGRTALHLAIVGNVHHKLVEILMAAPGLDVNVPDEDGMTPLDWLKRRPRSASSDILIRKLVLAGGRMLGIPEFSAREALLSEIKMPSNGTASPGTSFQIDDNEIFLHARVRDTSDADGYRNRAGINSCSFDSTDENSSSCISERPSSANSVRRRLKKFPWPSIRANKHEPGICNK